MPVQQLKLSHHLSMPVTRASCASACCGQGVAPWCSTLNSRVAKPSCRASFGAIKKAANLANKDDASRLVHHLISLGVLRLIAQRMERKENQSFVNTQQSVDVGPEAAALNAGRLKVTFAVKVCPFPKTSGR